jgi:hypothetical protein
MKERDKDFSNSCLAKEGYIFWQRSCVKCAKKAMPEEKAEKGLSSLINAINLYQRKLL